MFKKISNLLEKKNSIRGASIILIVTLTLSNVLGMLRDLFLTKNIAVYDLDIYYAAFRIPDAIFNALILGAITSAFIPIFSDFLAADKEKEGFRVTNYLVNLSVAFMAVCGVLIIILMPYLAPLVAKGFDPYRMHEVIKYSRILTILPIIFSVSYLMGGVLNSYKRFAIYSLAPIVYNLAIITGAAFLAPRFGLIGVIWMVIAGAFLHFLIQFVQAWRLGYRYQPIISFTDISVKRVVRLMIPRSVSMGANQILLLVYTSIASLLAAGSISAFSLANNIQTMPVVVLGTSFATAIFPTLTLAISKNKLEEFAFYLNRALRAIGFLLIPASAIFFMLRAQIIRLILGHGKFDWDSTKMTALALGFLALSILAQGVIPVISRAFYALKNTRTPMYISVATVVLSIAIAFPLARVYSVAGLAIAFSIGSYFNAIVLMFFLKRKYPKLIDKSMTRSYAKTLLGTVAMILAVHFSLPVLAGLVDMNHFFGVLAQTLLALLIAAVVYFAFSVVFKQEEMKWAFTRRISGEKPAEK